MRIITLFALGVACTFHVNAQNAKPAQKAAAKSATGQSGHAPQAQASPTLPIVGKHGGHIAISADKTKTELGYLPIFNSASGAMFLYAVFNTNNVIFPERPSLKLAFLSVAKKQVYAYTRSGVSIQADGIRMHFAEGEVEFCGKRQGVFYVEATGVTLSYVSLSELANAKNVTVRVGHNEFRLMPGHLEALRDMANRMRG